MHSALVALLFAQIVMHTPAADGTIYAELRNAISSDHSHQGDTVDLAVLEDWRDKDGHLLIPARAKLTGKIVLATKRRQRQPGSLSFVIENGESSAGSKRLHATIQSLVVMGVRRVSTDMPLRRGVDGNDIGLGPSSQELVDPVPKDCSVESVNHSDIDTIVVCRKRNVRFKEKAQVLLVDHAMLGK